MKRKPRVLFLCSWPIGAKGEGALSFVYEQIDELCRDLDGLFIQHRFASAPEWIRRHLMNRTIEKVDDLWPAERLSAIAIATPRLSTRLTGRTILEDVSRAADRVARAVISSFGRPDVIHAHVVLPAGLLAAGIARALRVPLLLQEHSGPFAMHLDTDEKRRCVSRVFEAAWRIGAVGSDLAQHLIEAGAPAEKVLLLPNLVATDRFRFSPPRHTAGPLQLISVGSLVQVKRFDLLIRAVALLQAQNVTAHLSIVGDGPLAEKLRMLAITEGVADIITFRGRLARDDTARALAEADIYVCSSEIETFGLAPAEALAVGRPVVTTTCGGPAEYVSEELGMVVRPEPADLARGIAEVGARLAVFDPQRLHATIDAAFGPSAFRRRLWGLYDEAMRLLPQA